jgi:hypothetical protein
MGESRFTCPDPQCSNATFKLKKDLTRHKRMHNPKSPLRNCGCCQNMGQIYKGNTRMDKVRDHLRSKHDTQKPEGRTLGERCPIVGCHTLLTAASCLHEHLRQEHPNDILETTSQTINGNHDICWHKQKLTMALPRKRVCMQGNGGVKKIAA